MGACNVALKIGHARLASDRPMARSTRGGPDASVDDLTMGLGQMQTLAEDTALDAALPSFQEIAAFSFDGLIQGIKIAAASSEGASVAAAGLFRLSVFTQRGPTPDTDEDAIVVTVEAMRAHGTAAAAVASAGCEVLAFMTLGARDPGADADLQRRLALALQAGGVQAVAAAMGAYAASSNDVLQRGVMALATLTGSDLALRQQAAAAGASAEWLELSASVVGGGVHANGGRAGDDDDEPEDDMAMTDDDEEEAPAPGSGMHDPAIDALVEAALCAVCAEIGEAADASLLAVRTPRQWLSDVLIAEARPLSEAALTAVDELLMAERTAGIAHAGPRSGRVPTAEGLQPNALWLPSIGTTRMVAWRGDVCELAVSAIVNPANMRSLGSSHKCIDHDIHRAAGPRLRAECRELLAARPEGMLPPGAPPLLTGGHALHAQHVLHVSGPAIEPHGRAPTDDERRTLVRCYTGCLEAAACARLPSVAFCCISSGLFGYPPATAAADAVGAVTAWLREHGAASGLEVVVFDVSTDEDAHAYADATASARQAGSWEVAAA